MEEDVIKKYFCDFCVNKRNGNCLKINSNMQGNVYCYKCENYRTNGLKYEKPVKFDYKIKSNKLNTKENKNVENRNTFTL